MPNPIHSHFGYADRSAEPLTGKYLPVSTVENLQWITIPWDVEYQDPENQHANPGGWTFLYGPADPLAPPSIFWMSGGIRLLLQEPGASCHIRPWIAEIIDGVDTRVGSPGESWEWFVGPTETGNTHVNGHWQGLLYPNQRLRLEVDYWNATHGCRIVGGSVRCLTWRTE